MNNREYGQKKEAMELDHEEIEAEKIIEAFRRVIEGKKCSVNDLQIVQNILKGDSSSSDKTHNLGESMKQLEYNLALKRQSNSASKSKLKRRGVDREKRQRMRRLEYEKKKKETEREL